MRTLVDIDEAELDALDRIAKSENVSRASLIRHAVRDYLGRNARTQQADAFGLWSDSSVDGLRYQEDVRSEW